MSLRFAQAPVLTPMLAQPENAQAVMRSRMFFRLFMAGVIAINRHSGQRLSTSGWSIETSAVGVEKMVDECSPAGHCGRPLRNYSGVAADFRETRVRLYRQRH